VGKVMLNRKVSRWDFENWLRRKFQTAG